MAIFNLLRWPTILSESRIRVKCEIPGDPMSKARPRFAKNKGGTVYTPISTKEAEEYLAWSIRASHSQLFLDESSRFGIRAIFYSRTLHRRDLDNMTKLVADACTGFIWKDDSQVGEICVRHEIDFQNPRTDLILYLLPDSAKHEFTCLHCGKVSKSYPSWQKRKYCSWKCFQTHAYPKDTGWVNCAACSKRFHVPSYRIKASKTQLFFCSQACLHASERTALTCQNCSKTFILALSGAKRRKFCSMECYATYRSETSLKYASNALCADCGRALSRPEYTRCAGCFARSRRFRNNLNTGTGLTSEKRRELGQKGSKARWGKWGRHQPSSAP